MSQTQTNGTILDTVGRAKHTLQGAHGPDAALVTVHGACPVSACRAMNVVEVHAGTDRVTCASCGAAFDV